MSLFPCLNGPPTSSISGSTGIPAVRPSAGDTNAEFEVFMANRLPDAANCAGMDIPYDENTEVTEIPERLF